MATFKDVGKKLDEIAAVLRSNGNKSRFADNWNWQASPLSVDDLADIAADLGSKFAQLGSFVDSDGMHQATDRLSVALDFLQSTTIPNLFSGGLASAAVLSTFQFAESVLLRGSPDKDFKQISSLTISLRNRATVAMQRVDSALGAIDGLESKIENIRLAHEAAEGLPITQQLLTDAITAIEVQRRAVTKLENDTNHSVKVAQADIDKISDVADKATVYLDKIEGAYRAVTSQGLAQAFKERQSSLNASMLLWVAGLLGALVAGGFVAHERFPMITAALTGEMDWKVVIVHLTLASLALSPAVWFGWVATMQIGQRFRLSEDYAYKAAISAAYEGYRAEAERLDPLLVAQLFSSALGRLDEIPLRLIDSHVSGSPFHEFLNSVEFKQASKAIPALADRAAELLRREPLKPAKSATPASDVAT